MLITEYRNGCILLIMYICKLMFYVTKFIPLKTFFHVVMYFNFDKRKKDNFKYCKNTYKFLQNFDKNCFTTDKLLY